MTVYMDICCLKRPFDDQTQARIALETTAILAILQAVAVGSLHAVRSSAHELENSRNPDSRRAGAVSMWLQQLNAIEATPTEVARRAEEIRAALGLRALDAVHLAWAEWLRADFFVTVDDRILSKAQRLADIIGVKVVGPIAMLMEFTP